MYDMTIYLNCTSCTDNTSNHDKATTSLFWTTMQLSVFSLVIGTAFIGNTLVCIAVCRFRQLQTTTNYAIVSLAITDVLMVYVMVLHASTVVKGEWTLGVTMCDVTSTIGLTLNLVSLVHLTYISLDRYLAIVKPFRYQVWITKRRVMVIMATLWFSTCLILNLPWADFKYRSNVFGCIKNVKRGSFRLSTLVILLAFVSLPTAFILFTHVSTFRIARTHAVQLQKLESNLQNTILERVGIFKTDRLTSNKTTSSTALKRNLKSLKTFAMVVGCFLICYIPFYTVATTRSFKGLDSVPEPVLTTVTWFAFINSCINPILYSLRNHQFRSAFKRIFRRELGRVSPLKPRKNRHRPIIVGTASGQDELSRTRDEIL